MDRLTKRIASGVGGVKRLCQYYYEGTVDCNSCAMRETCDADIVDRLADYEDLGLTPEQLDRLLDLVEELKKA